MIRWYRRPRPLATSAVLVLRAVGSLAVIVAYGVFRAPGLYNVVELFAALLIGAGVILFGLNAVTDLLVRRRDYLDPLSPSPLEVTDVLPSPFPRTPVTMLDDTDRFALHGEMFADTVAFEQGRARLIDRGTFVEPELLTHEYHPLTPPHGFPRHLLEDEAPQESGGRHRLADAQLGRERSHGQFGVW